MRRIALSAVIISLLGLGAYGVLDNTAPQPTMAQAQDSQTEVAVQPIDENAALLEDEENTISVIDTFGNSVVAINVSVRGEVVNPFEDFQDQLPPGFQLPPQFQQPQGEDGQGPLQQGTGSGFVVDEEGSIVTNFHVIESALQENSLEPATGAELTVVFPGSDEEYPATVVGVNALYDLALLKLDSLENFPGNVTAIPLADSNALRVGQKTIAIGNPFGLESTVTTGIISALNREFLRSIGDIDVPTIQTDAAINPGNSGGPLLNSRGEVIGINTAIIPTVSAFGDRGSLGIGFAVPSNVLRENLAGLQQGEYIGKVTTRPRIGIVISPIDGPRMFTPEEIREFNIPEGAAVVEVAPGGPGDRAGLRAALDSNQRVLPDATDVIISVDGQPISGPDDLQKAILGKGEGDVVTLKVWRNGEERDVDVTLQVVNEN